MKFHSSKFFFLSFLIFLFAASCSKDMKVNVYGPPDASIHFSDVSDFIIDSAGNDIEVKSHIASDAGIVKVALVYDAWNLNNVITSFSNANEYDFDEMITIPQDAALMIHSLKLEVTDKNGNIGTTEIKIGLEDLNYATLYLVDNTSASHLTGNLFGVPVAMNKVSSHTYQLTYYASDDNTSVRFIPNPESLNPVAIGADPSNNAKLITDAATSQPILLGGRGYYSITVNTLLLTYTVEKVAAQGVAFAEVALVGRGFYDYPDMNWQNTLPNIILLDKDSLNPFLFTKTIRLGIPPGATYASTQFILTTNNGWTDFWRFDDGLHPTKAIFNGGTNTDIPITSTPETYRFVFDSQTGIVQAFKQ